MQYTRTVCTASLREIAAITGAELKGHEFVVPILVGNWF